MITPSASPLSLPQRTPRPVPRAPVRPPELRPRFTRDGSRQLEDHLERTCAAIAAGIRGLVGRARLEGILLGGGYGRGEGGVWSTDDGDRPYNDLEFYVFLRGNRHLNEWKFGRALHVLGEILTPQAGVDVEFKIASRREFEAAAPSLFSHDLVMGHHLIAGNRELLAGCAHHRDASRIPLAEATRLLMNRGTGLLLARARLERGGFAAADADFVRRNIAKMELALGDALLLAVGQYHWSVTERHARISGFEPSESMPWLDEIRRRHAAGVEFKLHPDRSRASREALQATHAEVAMLAAPFWLWLEQRRLGRSFGSVRDYATEADDKFPELAGTRSTLINLRQFGRAALTRPSRLRRHPRERILNALPLLLWEPAACDDATLRGILQLELRSDATTFSDLMRAYRELWSRVN